VARLKQEWGREDIPQTESQRENEKRNFLEGSGRSEFLVGGEKEVGPGSVVNHGRDLKLGVALQKRKKGKAITILHVFRGVPGRAGGAVSANAAAL